MKALWNDKILAESDKTIVIENNHYFPSDSINTEFFRKSNTQTHCPWKGDASYYTLEVDGKQNQDAAWFYPEPKKSAEAIKDHVAFWKGVRIEE